MVSFVLRPPGPRLILARLLPLRMHEGMIRVLFMSIGRVGRTDTSKKKQRLWRHFQHSCRASFAVSLAFPREQVLTSDTSIAGAGTLCRHTDVAEGPGLLLQGA